MAFFQFRKGRNEQAAKLAPAQTVEAVRRRAMHRLIGAAVLVLAGVIGFPLVFDNQPRPIPVDLPIEIADKSTVKPLVMPSAAAPAAGSSSAVAPAPVSKPAGATESAAAATTTPALAPLTPITAAPAPTAAKAPNSPPETAVARTADAGKAQALLEGKDVAVTAPAGGGRFVVQVGAFAEPEKVREVRQKVEGAGLKTYTQIVETKDGKRTRVRVGPYTDKEQAQKVAEKIRKLDLSAAILTL